MDFLGDEVAQAVRIIGRTLPPGLTLTFSRAEHDGAPGVVAVDWGDGDIQQLVFPRNAVLQRFGGSEGRPC